MAAPSRSKEPLNKPLPNGCGWLGRLSGRALTRDARCIPRAEMPMAEFAVFDAAAKSTGHSTSVRRVAADAEP